MCGIAGYLSRRREEPAVLESMLATLLHRGPDSLGHYRKDDYHAGMRRLRINDLETGDQPLTDESGSIILFYNGEIYNAPSLRCLLESKGYRFKTRSDGEVICHLYHEYGENLFEHLDGMFAAALWIQNERKLILARDIPGEKPLYYARLPNAGLVFASEIKALETFPRLDLSLNLQALWDLPTFLWIPEPETVYREIQALPRSHLLIADGKDIRIRPYANRFNADPIGMSDTEVIDETRRVVTAAVESRLLSDVPIGSFLSSGLDSTIVTTLAARRLARLDTFTIGFEDLSDPYHGRADESADAEAYAKNLRTRHHTIHVTAKQFRDQLPQFIHAGDQPFAVSSGLGVLTVAQAAREHGIKVLLTGDGADECFGGYSWYLHLDRKAGWPGSTTGTDDVSFQDFGIGLEDRLQRMSGLPGPSRARAWHYYASEKEKEKLFHPDLANSAASSLRFFEQFKPEPDWRAEDFIQQDRDFYFPFEMMRKADRMTMEYSVEGRLPFAAPAVLSHARKLRYSHMVREGTLKWALREAFGDIVGPAVTARPKHGFNVPIDHWLKGGWNDLVQETFSPASKLSRAGIIGENSGLTANAMLNDPVRLNGHSILSYITLNLWLESRQRDMSLA